MWRRRRGPAIDSHDTASLARAALRTRVLRLALAGAALALLVAAAASARDSEELVDRLVPDGRTGVVVLDLSLSITDDDFAVVRRTLRRLVAEDAPVGLVIFSDVAYELLPPGAPAAELRPLVRLLVKPKLGPPVTPWSTTFSAGTRISTALELGRGMLERDGVEAGSIVLVSDLETAPDDVPALTRVVRSLRDDDVALRIVPLAPSSDALQIFEGLVDQGSFAPAPAGGAEDEAVPVATAGDSRLPERMLLLGALAFLALALHERFAGRLWLPSVRRTGAAT